MLAHDRPDPSAERLHRLNDSGRGFSFRVGDIDVAYSMARPYHVTIASSGFAQELFLPGGCDTREAEDVTQGLIDVRQTDIDGGRRITWRFRSSLWDKQVHLLFRPDRCEYQMEVLGIGLVDTLHIFEGLGPHVKDNLPVKHLNDKRSTPYGRYSTKSPMRFDQVLSPEPNVYHEQEIESGGFAQIGTVCALDQHGGNFIANPGIFCFVLRQNAAERCLALGLAVEPGGHRFSSYEYVGAPDGFGLRLQYHGRLRVDGRFATPRILLLFAGSEEEALRRYVDHLQAEGLVPTVQRSQYAWWRGPIVCGWGQQCHMADLFRVRSGRGRPPDNAAYMMCTQPHYEGFVRELRRARLEWTALIIDVQWTAAGGLKEVDTGRWPDMPGFVRRLHAAGKKVLLWWAPWEADGLSVDDCILQVVAPDPARGEVRGATRVLYPDISLPRVRRFLQERLASFLTQRGCDLDGLKLDHVVDTAPAVDLRYPSGSAEPAGVEMLHDYLLFLYTTAKSLKRDCLVIGQSPNPYFADTCDMVRIGPSYTSRAESVIEEMVFRARMARLAESDWLIDMDGWPMPSLAALLEYLPVQARLGVPSLYYSTHVDTTGEPLTAQAVRTIRSAWRAYGRAGGIGRPDGGEEAGVVDG